MALPSELLFLVLDNLGEEKDYNSLFQCALVSRGYAQHALAVLYRIYDTSPLRGGGTEDEQFRARRQVLTPTTSKGFQSSTLKKWTTLWRSIVLSTLGGTYLPYCDFIRYLDLDDLGNLLSSGPSAKDEFFTPELLEFLSHEFVSEGNKRRRSPRTLPDSDWTKVKLGSAIVQRNSLIRGMSCNVSPTTLNEWIAVLPQLQRLSVWTGDVLSQRTGEIIHKHCPDFQELRIYIWPDTVDKKVETDAEELFNALRPNSLDYFEVLSFSVLGPRSIKALGTQKASLTELRLTSLNINTIRELPSLSTMPKLETLALTDSVPTAWAGQFYQTVDQVADWIRSCKNLKRLELRRFLDDAELLSQVLTDDTIHLSTISFAGYNLLRPGRFPDALGSHQSLQTLYLRGEGSPAPEDNTRLIDSLSKLTDLTDLELKDVSDWFSMDNVMNLTPFLPHLERLWISGETFDDSIWPAFLCLPMLKSLSIYAPSNFTATEVIEFLLQLGPGNKGLNLSILNAVSPTDISDDAQGMIQEVLDERLQGSFDFGLAQEEFSDEDSDIELSD
ncbi:hypothetical protein BDW59DRAFT_137791 [Aspergillus cavernicola]|uniref:F-box domain-containing protein n=1 Tax=Aspergillus cavernicola TaxID=176166 RepID=A0ABR4J5V3_9EURO